MGNKLDTQSTVTLVINGEQSKTTLKEVTGAVNSLRASLSNMREEDNPELYNQKIELLRQMTEAQAAMREEINSGGRAAKGFFADFKEGFTEIKEIAEGVTIGTIISMGVRSAIETVKEFAHEMVDLAVKASGVDNAFAKIGNTEGLIEKLRASSRGLITDLDLEKIAIKANNANVPIDRMGTYLAFASQRARDTGENVTDLTTRLIEGIGKNSPKALGQLGFSVREVKEDFKRTGDMVETVSNIIKKNMAESGTDVDTFGDKVISLQTKWSNFKDKLAMGIASFLNPELADADNIQKRTAKELKEYGEYQKFEDDQLKKAIKNQEERVAAWKMAYERSQATLKSNSTTEGITGNYKERVDKAKSDAEAYQGARDALSALQTEGSKRDVNHQVTEDGDKKLEEEAKKAEAAREKELREREEYTDKVNALSERIRAFNEGELASIMAKDDKEVQSLKNKYDKEIAEDNTSLTKLKENKNANASDIKKAQDAIDKLTADKEKAVDALKIKQEEDLKNKILAIRKELEDKQVSEFQREIDAVNKKYDDQAKDIGNNADLQAENEAGRQAALNQLKLNQQASYQKDLKKLMDEIGSVNVDANSDDQKKANIDKEAAAEVQRIKDKYTVEGKLTKEGEDLIAKVQQEAALKKKKVDEQALKAYELKALDMAQSLSNSLFERAKNNRDQETNDEVSSLEKKKDAELSNANLTENQKAAISAKYAKDEADIKLKAWKANQDAAVEQALINGAIAVTKTFAELGWPAGILGAAAAIVETGIQVASIESQKPPQFAKGGLMTGPSHQAGGIPLIDGNTGKAVAEVEGDETVAVFSKEATANNSRIINELLYNSQYRNGAPVTVDSGLAIKAMNQYRTGGVIPGLGNPGAISGAAAGSGQAAGSDRLDRIESALHQFITEQRKENTKPIVLSRRVQEQDDARVAAIRDAANAK